jgi:hypothetical protein
VPPQPSLFTPPRFQPGGVRFLALCLALVGPQARRRVLYRNSMLVRAIPVLIANSANRWFDALLKSFYGKHLLEMTAGQGLNSRLR